MYRLNLLSRRRHALESASAVHLLTGHVGTCHQPMDKLSRDLQVGGYMGLAEEDLARICAKSRVDPPLPVLKSVVQGPANVPERGAFLP